MNKYLKIGAILAVIAAITTIAIQSRRISKLSGERDKYKTNTEVLLQDVKQWQIKDSLNVATVGGLRLRVKEFEQYRAADAEIIKSLRKRNQDLESVTTAQLQTITELRGAVRDTTIVMPGDTIRVPMQKLEYSDKWIDFKGAVVGKDFTAKITNRESLVLTHFIEYRRALGFLWKTKRVKGQDFKIVSKNPRTTIADFEVITVEK